jgi:hypothetical protein
MTRKAYLLFSLGLPCVLLNNSCAALTPSAAFGPGRQAGIVRSEFIREASGIVASRRNPGVLWVHNDSGDSARIFAISTEGDFLGVCTIAGAGSRDWEDIAIGPGPDPNEPYLYIGDIGDNLACYDEVTVYRVREPKVGAAAPFGTISAGRADGIRLVYPDSPRDAETLLVDPLTRDIYVVSKREWPSKVYRAAFPQSTTQPNRMERVGVLPWGAAVAGDVSSDGRAVIVRGMFNASIWTRPSDKPLWQAFSGKQTGLRLMPEPQGEGICFDRNNQGYFTIGEMLHPPLHYFGPAEPNTPRPPG